MDGNQRDVQVMAGQAGGGLRAGARLALLSDVHGNPIALDAVLADITRQGGADAYWVLGDLVAIGYDPVTVLERLTSLPNVRFTQGNTDRYVVTGEGPHPHIEDAAADPTLLPLLVGVAQSFAWTRGYVTSAGWYDWLAALPFAQRATLPDGTRLLGVHVAPDRDDGMGVHPALDDSEVRVMLHGCEANLVCVGHMHWPSERIVDGIRVVNVGNVSNPWAVDLRASYAMLTATETGYLIQHHWASYSTEAVIEAIRRSRHPSTDFITGFFQGLHTPAWLKEHGRASGS
jgi:predicted phosphodiesterase